jgi:hypothetical protein
MTASAPFEAGNYRYVPGPFQYSGGVAAEPGFELERVRFRKPLPIVAGFEAIEAHLKERGRPLTAFAACEMRSPAPFTEAGFIAFNRVYVGTLERWGIFKDDVNPVARSNVCPEIGPPAEPCFEAFTFTVPSRPEATDAPSFVVAGSGEAVEGAATYEGNIVALGDTSPAGLLAKARHVLGEMERRMEILGVSWADATTTQVYTVYDLHPFLANEIVARGAACAGLTWFYARPPVVGLDYEMDLRGIAVERVL